MMSLGVEDEVTCGGGLSMVVVVVYGPERGAEEELRLPVPTGTE